MWLRRHIEVASDREQALEHPADRDLLDRKTADRLAGCAQRRRELLHIVVRRDILRFEVDLGDAAVIAGDQPVEDLGQPHPRPSVDAAHDPEVDRGDAPVRKREQIAVVEVGVEETVDHRLAQEGADEDRCKRVAVLTGRDQRIAVVELDPVEPFQCEHAACRSPPVDLRYVIARLGDHILAQLRRGCRLTLQVELARGPLAEVGDD